MPQACLSSVVVCRRLSSVTFVDCGQTAIDRLMISSLSDRANTWLRQALNSIEIGLAVFEQWRLQWGYPPFRVDRARLIGHIFGSIARRNRRTAKIMASYYRQLFTANPVVLTPLSVDDLWRISSQRLLLGPGCLYANMFTIAQLIKLHLDL